MDSYFIQWVLIYFLMISLTLFSFPYSIITQYIIIIIITLSKKLCFILFIFVFQMSEIERA